MNWWGQLHNFFAQILWKLDIFNCLANLLSSFLSAKWHLFPGPAHSLMLFEQAISAVILVLNFTHPFYTLHWAASKIVIIPFSPAWLRFSSSFIWAFVRCFPIFVDCRDLRIIRTHAFKMKLEHRDNKTDKLKRRCVSPRIALTSRITTQLFLAKSHGHVRDRHAGNRNCVILLKK